MIPDILCIDLFLHLCSSLQNKKDPSALQRKSVECNNEIFIGLNSSLKT